MNKVVIKNTKSGLFFVEGTGFAGSQASATRFANAAEADQVLKCAARFGIAVGDSVIEAAVEVDPNIKQNADGSSFAVNFVRAKSINADGSINTHRLNPSKRRFATIEEARHHGSRFVTIEKHLGFYVTKTTDPVNAWVNQGTGKTNPEIGKKRTNR